MSIQHILRDCGLNIAHFQQVHGGDSNRAYCLHVGGTKYFLKVNEANRYPAMFEKEINGLHALHKNSTLIVPRVIKSGIVQQEQYLLLEWLERGNPGKDFWQNFGAGLSMLHQKTSSFFGWGEDNFIGSLVQRNQQHHSWHLFYGECRIMPLVKALFNAGTFSKHDLLSAESFCKKIEQLFPLEPPALLHGDLWNGNYMVSAAGYAVIFDPAIYYGHREMDIGMTNLFGGFDRQFYAAYNESNPLEKGWQQRLPLTQLYPLLVHAVLFGGHYVSSAKETMKLGR
ncbi:MAG: fructosamine kinase family protein, partial [Ferruginibacter sp.]|nr:fructosamine kinase family protein [Ferruginibacter sp.]